MRLRGMAVAAVAALAACSPTKNGGPKQGTVVVTGTASQDGMVAAQKPSRAQVAVVSSVGDPTNLTLTVFKTELFDGTAWVTIFESASGKAVDLVSDAGAAFGQGTVPAATYGKVRFTVGTQATFSAGAFDTCAAAANASFLIDAAQGAPARTPLTFATASQGGSGSWTANGSTDFPFLISAPIEVRDAATTRVILQFDTTGTVSCTGEGLAIPRAPQMHASSVVIPKVQSFVGGQYWVSHYNLTGETADFSAAADLGSAETRADYRRRAGSNLGWGMKASFTAPTADGVGILKLSGGMAEHRRRVDETGCTECGYQAPTPGDQYLLYTIDADRRVSFTVPNGPRIVGAFSESFDALVGATIEGDRGSADLVFGIEAGTVEQTVTGRYAWASMNGEFAYPADSFVASNTYTGWAFGWAKLDDTSHPDLGQYMSDVSFLYPALAYGNGGFSWNAGMKPQAGDYLPPSVTLDATGVGSLLLGDGTGAPQWTVATPNGGRVMLTLGDVTVANRATTGTKYDQNVAVMLKQAAPGTHSLASLAGRWTVVTRTNELSHFGDDVVSFRGVEYGTVTVGANGAASFDVVRVDDGGNVLSDSGSASVRVQKACIGRVGGAGEGGDSLAWNDATCAADGGDVLDVAVLYVNDAGTSRDVAWFVVDETASVAAIVSADGYLPDRAGNGPAMIGYMVRASR